MPSTSYPAVKHYWFGKAYRDMLATMKDAHARNMRSAEGYWQRVGKGNWLANIFCSTAAAMVIVAGTAMWLVLVPVHVAIVALIAFVIMVLYGVTDLCERCYLLYKGWSTVCRHCGDKVSLPEYQCPRCREWHSRLRPSSYGVFQHRCRCGEKLSCTFLSTRHALTARCPHEHCKKPLDANVDTRSTTAVLALIGPPNSGKTGFMVAAMETLIEKIAPKRFLVSRFTDRISEEFFQDEKESIAISGGTRKTVDNKPPAFNIFFHSKDERIRHQVFFFDAAGEIFLSTDRMHGHYQFKHLTGGIILIDPFSLPGVKQKHGAALKKQGLDSIVTQEEAIDTIDRFLIGMQRHFGLKQDRLVKCPYAVVVTKVDLCGLHRELQVSSFPAGATMEQKRQLSSDHVRKRLQDWGAAGLINQIEARFSNAMYFVAAPIRLKKTSTGHSAELASMGVVNPIRWVLEEARDPLGG